MYKINIKQYIKDNKKFPIILDNEELDAISVKVSDYTKPMSVILRTKDTTDNPELFSDKLKLGNNIATTDDFHAYIDSFNVQDEDELESEKDVKKRKQGYQGISGTGDGIHFDSKWEYGYFVYTRDIEGINIERNTSDFLYYIDAAGKRRKFYYDFLVASQMVEVKGIFRANDVLKMEQCPQVHFVYGDEMKKILGILKKERPDWETGFISD